MGIFPHMVDRDSTSQEFIECALKNIDMFQNSFSYDYILESAIRNLQFARIQFLYEECIEEAKKETLEFNHDFDDFCYFYIWSMRLDFKNEYLELVYGSGM